MEVRVTKAHPLFEASSIRGVGFPVWVPCQVPVGCARYFFSFSVGVILVRLVYIRVKRIKGFAFGALMRGPFEGISVRFSQAL